MNLNTMRTETSLAGKLMSVVMSIVLISGTTETAAAPQLLQPLSSQFISEAKGYATGYGYSGVQVPVAVQVGKTVQYAAAPPPPPPPPPPSAVVGYAPSFVYKPDLSAYAAASFPQVEQLHRFNPVVRPVHTVVPKVTAVEPSVTVQKTYVDVPVPEYRPPAAAVVVQDASPYNYYNYQLIDRK
ncbi:uncharacterized protein LOC112690746 [Sipha flava]|uniref:Uncharacterized protein LOC112690746 n=1 Tax=Sipha flava TaxID=143950 RepID=A0A2S2Q528_9HEMI|nr:uncharacterized protein LOC112690746 [Sipha flava]